MSHVLTLTLPDDLYQLLATTANVTQCPLDEVAVQSLKVGSPPGLEGIPEKYHADLTSLSALSDEELRAVSQIEFPTDRFAMLEELLRGNANSTLTESERQQLAQLEEESNRLMIRRAYVFALLRWRGHRIPELSA